MQPPKRVNLNLFIPIILIIVLLSCNNSPVESPKGNAYTLEFNSSDTELVKAFDWAKEKALSYSHDGSDPVGYWYEAALPNREAFCMRDVSHQAIGAEIIGLGKHNYNMILQFARNISKEKDYCTYWEINRYNNPAPVDYESDADFWYNLPSNFDLIYSAYRLYKWTGNKDYLLNSELINFYELSLNEYADHWDLGSSEILDRNRSLHVREGGVESRFGINRGIPTYNEGGRGETTLGIDMTASMIAAYKAYSDMLKVRGKDSRAEKYIDKAKIEKQFLDTFWWDNNKQEYKTIQYADGTFDHFMVGDNQAFLHYLLYFNVVSSNERILNIVDSYESNFDKLIVELKSYLPIIFYEHGKHELANEMIISLCSIENERRDYPENSFTVIEHITRGFMGINVNATDNGFSTLSRLEKDERWAEMKFIPIINNKISVKHFGNHKTKATNENGGDLNWTARIPGNYEYLYVNGDKKDCKTVDTNLPYSYCTISLKEGDEVIVSIAP